MRFFRVLGYEGFLLFRAPCGISIHAQQEDRQQVLNYVADHLKGIRLLEVEPMQDEMTTRRVRYYQRNGYQVLEEEYIQPSYDGVRGFLFRFGLWETNILNVYPSL